MRSCVSYFKRACNVRPSAPVSTQDHEQPPSYADLFGDTEPSHHHLNVILDDKLPEKQHLGLSSKEKNGFEKVNDDDSQECPADPGSEDFSPFRRVTDDPDWHQLSAKCRGCHARARVARAYLEHRNISCKRYLRTVGQSHQLDLNAALTLTLRHIKKLNPDAAQLFRFFAYFHHADLAYSLLAATDVIQATWVSRITSSPQEYDKTIKFLQEYGLVECTSDVYRIHPLIHKWISQPLDTGAPLFSTFAMALRCVASSYDALGPLDKANKPDRFMLHADHLLKPKFDRMWHFARQDFFCVEAISSLARCYQRWNHPEKARVLSEPIMNMIADQQQQLEQQQTQDETPAALPLTAIAMSNLAKSLAKDGKKEEALQLYKQALEVFDANVADRTTNPIHRLKTLRRLGCLYGSLGRLSECEKTLRQVLNAVSCLYSPETRDLSLIVRVTADLGICRHEQGRYADAISLYQSAIHNYESLLKLDDATIMLVYTRIGDTYSRMGRNIAAERAYQRAMHGYTRRYGASHKRTIAMTAFLKRRKDFLEAARRITGVGGAPDGVMEFYRCNIGPAPPPSYRYGIQNLPIRPATQPDIHDDEKDDDDNDDNDDDCNDNYEYGGYFNCSDIYNNASDTEPKQTSRHACTGLPRYPPPSIPLPPPPPSPPSVPSSSLPPKTTTSPPSSPLQSSAPSTSQDRWASIRERGYWCGYRDHHAEPTTPAPPPSRSRSPSLRLGSFAFPPPESSPSPSPSPSP